MRLHSIVCCALWVVSCRGESSGDDQRRAEHLTHAHGAVIRDQLTQYNDACFGRVSKKARCAEQRTKLLAQYRVNRPAYLSTVILTWLDETQSARLRADARRGVMLVTETKSLKLPPRNDYLLGKINQAAQQALHARPPSRHLNGVVDQALMFNALYNQPKRSLDLIFKANIDFTLRRRYIQKLAQYKSTFEAVTTYATEKSPDDAEAVLRGVLKTQQANRNDHAYQALMCTFVDRRLEMGNLPITETLDKAIAVCHTTTTRPGALAKHALASTKHTKRLPKTLETHLAQHCQTYRDLLPRDSIEQPGGLRKGKTCAALRKTPSVVTRQWMPVTVDAQSQDGACAPFRVFLQQVVLDETLPEVSRLKTLGLLLDRWQTHKIRRFLASAKIKSPTVKARVALAHKEMIGDITKHQAAMVARYFVINRPSYLGTVNMDERSRKCIENPNRIY